MAKERNHEGNHIGWRNRLTALSADASDEQASAAGVRQADDLLPAANARGGRNPRYFNRHGRQQRRRFSAAAPQWKGFWTRTSEFCLSGGRRRNCRCAASGGMLRSGTEYLQFRL